MRLCAAVDVHDGAASAVHQAIPWARRLSGTLDLLFASEWSTEGLPTPPYRTDELDALWADWNRSAADERAKLDALVAGLPAEIRGVARFVAGRPVDVVPDATDAYDLLIVASHGRAAVERVMLGSVTGRLIRNVRTPVLVTGLGDPVPDPTSRLLVLAPVDDLDPGALPWIGHHLGGERVEVVHVMPPDRSIASTFLSDPTMPLEPVKRKMTLEAMIHQRAAAHGFPGTVVHVVPRRTGNPGDAIADLARQLAPDLIVLPTHGRKGLEHLFIGSVAERVVHRSPCPVLVVPLARLGD
ncbi:MAG: universal stress protein [Myxococcota bacterium]